MMHVGEILRKIADALDGIAGSEQPNPDATDLHLAQGKAEREDNAEKAAAAEEDLGDFIPPLQQKLELLKKAVDVPSYYDEEGEPDELAVIKRNAGINPVALDALGDDEPLEG